MYQSFTGTSRRHRQVNLSGRSSNPFAANSSSPGTGPQSAIASAQADRISRQQQRDRLQASSSIQRVWRGHSVRRRTFKTWRQIWDEVEDCGSRESQREGAGGAYRSPEESLAQLARLLLFYNPQEDVKRLTWYGMRQVATSDAVKCEGGPWPKAYLKLERACISALQEGKDAHGETTATILTILAFSVRRTQLQREDAVRYYKTLTSLENVPGDALQPVLLSPLKHSPEAYVGLALLLAQPQNSEMLALLKSSVEPQLFAQALSKLTGQEMEGGLRSSLWLLGNIIFLGVGENNQGLIAIVSRLLGSLADDVEFDGPALDTDNVEFDRHVLSKISTGFPLNKYLSDQVNSLIDQKSIRNLLVRDASSTAAGSKNARTLAEYALTLLRCFPRRADDIRMWLYLGPSRSDQLPATQYFWASAKASNVFATIWRNSRDVTSLIKASNPDSEMKDDWTFILVFLELYTFVLKIMDDEEFVRGGQRNSAIQLSEVAQLVTFLKNLGFSLYFNASELTSSGDTPGRDDDIQSLSRHFGHPSTEKRRAEVANKPAVVAGLPGLTIDYLKGLVTGLLRAIYERDSRRHFLPHDHWLMTSRFDMTAFIPGVVAEEESRHMVQDQDDEDKYEESDEDEPFPVTSGRGHASGLRLQAARDRAQRKASRKRYLESVAPRLEILQNMPFFIPFTTRVEIFRKFVQLDQQKRRNGYTDPDLWRQSVLVNGANGRTPPHEALARHHAKIKRKNEFDDAFEQFYTLGADLKEPIQITFVDEFDIPEAGIDGGGVTKEFLTSVITQVFDQSKQGDDEPWEFFVENDKHLLYPNPTVLEDRKAVWKDRGYHQNHAALKAGIKTILQQFEFLGRIIGKCLYEGILVDVSFAGFFLKKWALTGGTGSAPGESGYRPNINDLRELDEGLYKGLLSLKNCAPEDVESLGLTFTVDDLVGGAGHKQAIERELAPDGANIPVTSENRLIYINRISSYRLQGQSSSQTSAFLKGLSSIIQPSWLSMFNQTELQTLIGGAAAEINVADLRRNTLYGGTYAIGDDGAEHASVRHFWNVMAKFPDKDRRAVLKFVTSTPRGPLLGFSSLNPKFSIRDSGSDENRYPTTSTCVNLLKLPMYRSEEVLREKLLAAVNSGAGFDLS